MNALVELETFVNFIIAFLTLDYSSSFLLLSLFSLSIFDHISFLTSST
jgi:hypothetical protein